MKIGLLILTLVAQPVWWGGLLREWFTADKRIRAERRSFGSAVYGDKFEVRHYLLLSLLYGLIASVVSVVLGLTLPVAWVIGYSCVALIGVLIGPAAGLSMTILVVTALLYDQFGQSNFGTQLAALGQPFGLEGGRTPLIDLLLLFVLALIIMGIWVTRTGGKFAAPKIFAQKRGKLIAGYRFNELLVVPTLIFVPGDWITSHLSFWPVFAYGTHTVTPLFLPLLLGIRLTFFKQTAHSGLSRMAKWLISIGILGILLSSLTFLVKGSFLPVVLGMYLLYLLVLLWTRWQDRRQSFWFSKVDRGVRVLGIKPETPAAKMTISVGDIIVTCNQQPVNSESEFYKALLINPTYCHLKIQTPQGDLKVTETAIFAGAPHEIGIVVFRD